MKNKIYIVIASMLLIIFGLITYIIFSKENSKINKFDETKLREQIKQADSNALYWSNQALYWQNVSDTLKHKSDSLEAIKIKNKIKTDDKIKFNNSANILQLDSIIKSNW